MCGIAGVLNYHPHQQVSSDLLVTMVETMVHRGPDGQGTYVAGSVGLGHRRLSIIDLSGGHQPMSNEDGTVWVTFNGEIYNYRALRDELAALGHRFASSSDTEVLVHAYEEWGEASVCRLEGMFAYAIWDARRRRLMLARDRVGIKPLYYARTPTAFVFASELKALLAHPGVRRTINPHAIARFLTYYYTAGCETTLADVAKVPPGYYLIASADQVALTEYWDLASPSKTAQLSFDDAVDQLRALLSQTVARHMMSDVPVGVLLSGGLDSTGILSYATSATDRPLHTFTIGFGDEDFVDERPFARAAAQRFGSLHQEARLSAADFLSFLPRYVWHMEEPVCEPPAIALYFVSRLARTSGVKVLLSGEGGDEAFAGYQTYRTLLWLERAKLVAGPARPALRTALLTAAAAGAHRLAALAALIPVTPAEYYYSRTATPHTFFNRSSHLYRPEFVASLDGYERGDVTAALFSRAPRSLLDRMLYVDSKSWLPDDLLVKADKMTMATSVELRVPLLDAAVLEFAASLPSRFKLRGWSGKRILKAALKDAIPPAIVRRPKAGFPVPYARWLRQQGRDMLRDLVASPGSALSEYLEPACVSQLIDAFERDGRFAKEAFSLLTLELWLRTFSLAAVPRRTDSPSPLAAGAAR